MPMTADVNLASSTLNDPTSVGASTTAGIAASVVADSGALTVGTYRVEVSLGFSGVLAAGKHIVVQHRDAANTATVKELGLCPAGDSNQIEISRLVIAATERVRVVLGAVAAGAGEVAHASIRAYKL